MPRDAIEMTLTAKKRSLLLRYGYPFEQIESALQACSKSTDIEIVPMDFFELEQLIGNLCYSINRMKSGGLLDQFLDLCDRLEAAERDGDGRLDLL